MQQLTHRLLEGEGAVLDRGAHVVGGHGAYEILAVPGRRDRAHAVLGVGPRADDRRVADAPGSLVGHPAGRGGGGEIAVAIARHGPHGARRGGHQIRDVSPALLGLELLEALRGAEVMIGHERQALFERELLGAGAHQQHMPRLLHHPPRELDRIPHVPHGSDRAGAHLPAVHDRRVELGRAVAGQRRAVAGVEARIVLEQVDRRGDRIQCAAAALEQRKARVEGRLEAGAVAPLVLGRELRSRRGSGAAVDRERVPGRARGILSGHRGTWRCRGGRASRARRGTCRRC